MNADVGIRSSLGNNDHRVVMCAVNYRKERNVGKTRTLNCKKANFIKLHSLLYYTGYKVPNKEYKTQSKKGRAWTVHCFTKLY